LCHCGVTPSSALILQADKIKGREAGNRLPALTLWGIIFIASRYRDPCLCYDRLFPSLARPCASRHVVSVAISAPGCRALVPEPATAVRAFDRAGPSVSGYSSSAEGLAARGPAGARPAAVPGPVCRAADRVPAGASRPPA